MIRRRLAAVAVALLALLVLAGCGDDGGGGDGAGDESDLVELLQDTAGQPENIAGCVAERVLADDAVDRDELEAIIRGEGTTDTDTSDAYADAAFACAQIAAGVPSASTTG